METKRRGPHAGFVHFTPQIVACESNMLPAQWRDVREQFVQHLDATAA